MKVLFQVIFLSLLCHISYCQFAFNNVPNKLIEPLDYPYQIIQYSDNSITQIEEFDRAGHSIYKFIVSETPSFFHWDEPLMMIYAEQYDSDGRVNKMYAFHSNAGHNIYLYEYDDIENSKKTFEKKLIEDKEFATNSNPYANISRLKTYQDVIQSSETLNILKSQKKQIWKEYFDENDNIIKKVSFDSYFGDTTITNFEYNDRNELVKESSYDANTNKLKKEEVIEYLNDSTQISTLVKNPEDKDPWVRKYADQTSAFNKTETNYSVSSGILEIRQKYFDQNSYLIKILVYETKYKGELIIPITSELDKTAQMEYFYNKDGLMIKEKLSTFEDEYIDTRKYKYKIKKMVNEEK